MIRLVRCRPGEKGFTLIEMILSLALTAFIGLGTSVAIAQVTRQTAENSNYTTASQQAMNAIHWIGQDVQMAQTINGTAGFPVSDDLVLSWTWWDNTVYTITYSLNDGVLRRVYDDGAGGGTNTVIADSVNDDPDLTYCVSDNNSYNISVTIDIGAGQHAARVTRTRDVAARPHL
jgi:prepilin-type N-terminal cleavage/methylation domain-containing protein